MARKNKNATIDTTRDPRDPEVETVDATEPATAEAPRARVKTPAEETLFAAADRLRAHANRVQDESGIVARTHADAIDEMLAEVDEAFEANAKAERRAERTRVNLDAAISAVTTAALPWTVS